MSRRSRRRLYFSCINIVRVKHVLFMACSSCVIVILRRCILIMNVVLIIASRTCTPNALRMTREGDTRCIEIRFPLTCTIRYARTSATSHTMDRVQACIQDLRKEGLSQYKDIDQCKVWSISKRGKNSSIASGIY